MKKLIGLFLVLLLVISATLTFAASSLTQTQSRLSENVDMLEMAWTASADGSFTSSPSVSFNGYIFQVTTIPGYASPTANYDITLTDSDGVDVMGAELSNRSASANEQVKPKMGNDYGDRFVAGGVSLNISNNASANATGKLKIYYRK